MNAPFPSRAIPPPRRVLGIVAIIALSAGILTFALRHGKTPAGSPTAATPAPTATPPPPPSQPALPERLRAALAPAEPASDPRGLARVEALRALGKDLTPAETNALLAALLAPRRPSEPPGPHSVWFHETALALQGQATIRGEFATTLTTVARDTRRDPVVRDYALQHLCQLWHTSEATLAADIRRTLSEIADQAPAIAPSALLALHRLGTTAPSTTPAVPEDELTPRLRTLLASSGPASTAAHMTALRIIGERRLTGFRGDLARIAADTTSRHTLARMAAVAAIARLADPRDLPLLRNLDRSDPRIATAIDHAIARLESQP